MRALRHDYHTKEEGLKMLGLPHHIAVEPATIVCVFRFNHYTRDHRWTILFSDLCSLPSANQTWQWRIPGHVEDRLTIDSLKPELTWPAYQDDDLTTGGVQKTACPQGRADRADLLDGFVHGHQHGERLPNASSAAIDTHLAIRHKRLPQRSLRDVENFPHNHWLKYGAFPSHGGIPVIIHEICSDFPLQIIQLLGIPHLWKPTDIPPKSAGQSTQVVHLELGCAEGCSWSIPGEERSGTLEAPGLIYPLDAEFHGYLQGHPRKPWSQNGNSGSVDDQPLSERLSEMIPQYACRPSSFEKEQESST